MSTALIAFGSNLGDRATTIEGARVALQAHPSISVVTMSSLHSSVALKVEGEDPSAPPYLNAVARIETTLAPAELLAVLMEFEREAGRERTERWGDRTLDLDIITYDDLTMRNELLDLPHPRAASQLFVLEPWLEIEPHAHLSGVPVVALAAHLGSTRVPDEHRTPKGKQ